MELLPPSITEVYNTYQGLYIAINIHASKEGYPITTKRQEGGITISMDAM